MSGKVRKLSIVIWKDTEIGVMINEKNGYITLASYHPYNKMAQYLRQFRIEEKKRAINWLRVAYLETCVQELATKLYVNHDLGLSHNDLVNWLFITVTEEFKGWYR